MLHEANGKCKYGLAWQNDERLPRTMCLCSHLLTHARKQTHKHKLTTYVRTYIARCRLTVSWTNWRLSWSLQSYPSWISRIVLLPLSLLTTAITVTTQNRLSSTQNVLMNTKHFRLVQTPMMNRTAETSCGSIYNLRSFHRRFRVNSGNRRSRTYVLHSASR